MMSAPFAHRASGRHYSGRTNVVDGFTPASEAPLIVALHGGSYTSEYFDIPGYSLLDRATAEGIPLIALDRPNYAESSELDADGSIILANAKVINEGIASIWEAHGAGAPGIVLVAHSIGAAVATAVATEERAWPLLGLAISGCLVRVPPESRAAWESLPPIRMVDLPSPVKDGVMFGPEGSFSADMPEASYPSNALVPKAELLDITGDWIERRAEVCARVSVPVHHRQGEHDRLWVTSQGDVEEFRSGFPSAPSIDSRLELGAGHCIDFHLASEGFQLEQLRFARACARA